MLTSDYKQWLKMSPLLYTYLSSTQIPEYAAITAASFSKDTRVQKSFKYQAFKLLIAARTHAGNGVFSVNQADVPLFNQLNDQRLNCQIIKKCEIVCQNPIACYQEFIVTGGGQTFVALNQQKRTQISLYSLNPLLNMKEKTYAVKPRVTLQGREEMSVLRSREDEMLSGGINGQIGLFNIRQGGQPTSFRYHREAVTDLCWLGHAQERFVSSSGEAHLYIWDRRMPAPALKIQHKQKHVGCLQYLKGNCLLSGGADGSVKYWDIRSNSTEFFSFREQMSPVRKLCRVGGEEGKIDRLFNFVSGGHNGEVLLWEQELEFSHGAHTSGIVALGFNRQCELFMSVQENSSAVCLWKPAAFSLQ